MKLIIEQPELYVDNESRYRSGHMTHAMAAFAPNCFMDFDSNCSAVRSIGHSPFGWVEYRVSRDGGKSYSESKTLQYSMDSLLDGVYTISVEKAVGTATGRVVAICLQNSTRDEVCCEPWGKPMITYTDDAGESWSTPTEMSPYGGRVYDARYHDGAIYALHFCNEYFLGEKPEDLYRLYKSTDNGETFEEVSVIPFDAIGRGYGALIFDQQGGLHAFAYNSNAEEQMDHAFSPDGGKTWDLLVPCYLAQGIRNPQIGFVDGTYVLHGRAGGVKGFVFYTSPDLKNWDEGDLFIAKEKAYCFYSNNLPLRDERGNFLLVQYSDVYDGRCRVNVYHTKVRIE